MGELPGFIHFKRPTKLQNLTAGGGISFRNLLLTKNAQWKNYPSPILKKFDFSREIQNFVTPSIMEIDKISNEIFLFLTRSSTQ